MFRSVCKQQRRRCLSKIAKTYNNSSIVIARRKFTTSSSSMKKKIIDPSYKIDNNCNIFKRSIVKPTSSNKYRDNEVTAALFPLAGLLLWYNASSSSSSQSSSSSGSGDVAQLEEIFDENKKKKNNNNAPNKSGGNSNANVEKELLQQHKCIYIMGSIDDKMAKSVIMDLMWLAKNYNTNADDTDDDPVTIYIHSSGGSVVAGLAIYDIMKSMPYPIRTVCLGKAYSMAAILLSAGKIRHALPNSHIMIHQPSQTILKSQKASDVVIQTDYLLHLKNTLLELLSDNMKNTSTIPKKELESMMDRDKYMTSYEAQKLGIIDTIGPITNLVTTPKKTLSPPPKENEENKNNDTKKKNENKETTTLSKNLDNTNKTPLKKEEDKTTTTTTTTTNNKEQE